LPFALSKGFLKGGRFTRTGLQESLNLVQYAFDRSENDPTILLGAYGSNAFSQSEALSKFRRNYNLPLGTNYHWVSHIENILPCPFR
jgi:hypothetical protein